MLNKTSFVDNYVFLLSVIISSSICYFLLTPMDAFLGGVAVLFTFAIYSVKPDNGDYAYVFFWILIILLSCYIGSWLKMSTWFYLFLFGISCYYYISYQKDFYSDIAIPFVVIYASYGTTIADLDYQSGIAFLIGALVSLAIMGIAYKRKIVFTAFKTGLFSKSIFINPSHVQLKALVYSTFLFLCLSLPDQMGLAGAYWVPTTFILLLKPKEENIIKNTLIRFVGSVLGAFFVLAILKIGVNNEGLKILLLFIFIFFLPSLFKINRLFRTFATSVFVLLLLETSTYLHASNFSLPHIRIIETFIGGSLAITCSIVLKMMRKHHVDIDE